MKFLAFTPCLTFTIGCMGSVVHAQTVERDQLHGFSLTRPNAWLSQDKPSPSIRVMLGIEGDGYAGNCNVSALSSPSTQGKTQAAVDANENKRPLGIANFRKGLISVAPDVDVISAAQVKRGSHFGHLVHYTYSYMSPSLRQRIYVRAEMFSHSRPGKVFTLTCNVGALSAMDAQQAFSKESKGFEALSSSLRFSD